MVVGAVATETMTAVVTVIDIYSLFLQSQFPLQILTIVQVAYRIQTPNFVRVRTMLVTNGHHLDNKTPASAAVLLAMNA